MKKILFTLLLAFGTTLLATETPTPIEAETFTLTNTEGEIIKVTELEEGLKFEKYHGRAVFLVLFGHMCPPCNAEIPEFIELTKAYPEKLAIVALRYNDTVMKISKNSKKRKGSTITL